MTRQDVGYYVLAALLFAASIPLYRVILAHAHDADQPEQSPRPVVAESTQLTHRAPVPVPETPRVPIYYQPHAVVTGVECREGFLIESLPGAERPVARDGRLVRCDIHATTPEEARRVSSADPSVQ